MNKIAFHFHPNEWTDDKHFVEKALPGQGKRRYLIGVSSGLKMDGHGERMTPECIDGFMEQANSGDVLLYAGKHDVDFTDDVGILTKAEILPTGDWYTEYRLFDEADNVGPYTLEKSDTLWRQMSGLPPYKKKKEKGFSIEGHIPENGIEAIGPDDRRVIRKVNLDGVVVVPRPSYQDSIAHAVYKALDAAPPWVLDKTRETFHDSISSMIMKADMENDYYSSRYKIDDALENVVKEIMISDKGGKSDRLHTAFKEYSAIMVDTIMKSADIFVGKDRPRSKADIFKDLRSHVETLQKSLIQRYKQGV